MIIDSHQHFWNYDLQEFDWIEDEVLKQDFLPEDLEPVFKENGVSGCIAVQARQSIQENDFLLKLAEQHEFIKGIIGWVDLKADDLEDKLEKYAFNAKIKGFRHVVQGEPDPLFLLQPQFLNGIKKLKKHNFVYEILVFPHQLPAVLEFVKLFPEQQFVLDHIGKPYIARGFYDAWAVLVKELALHANVCCKISGLVTEADPKNLNYKRLRPYLEHVIQQFGIDRILFGSDWPVCTSVASYDKVQQLAKTAVEDRFSISESEKFWSTNAIEVYNLDL